MVAFIQEICEGENFEVYEFIINNAFNLQKQGRKMKFRELIDLLKSNGYNQYSTELGVSNAIKSIFKRSVTAYRDYDKVNDFTNKDNADKVCDAIAFSYTRNDGKIAWK